MGGTTLQPWLLPGHTRGGLCWLAGDHLFTGDTLFINGCGICTGRGGDAGEMFETMQRLQRLCRADTRIWPGHGFGEEPGQTFATVLQKNVYLQLDDREMFIRFRNRKNQRGLMDF